LLANASQAYAAACVGSLMSWRAQCALHWWRGLVEARALIGRVLLQAHNTWELAADSALIFGSQFQMLHQV